MVSVKGFPFNQGEKGKAEPLTFVVSLLVSLQIKKDTLKKDTLKKDTLICFGFPTGYPQNPPLASLEVPQAELHRRAGEPGEALCRGSLYSVSQPHLGWDLIMAIRSMVGAFFLFRGHPFKMNI